MEEKIFDPFADFQSCKLASGFTLQHLQIDRPFVDIRIAVRTGSLEDPVGKEGIAHFTEHLFSQNGNLPLVEMIRLFKLGINPGSTGNEKVEYSCRIQRKKEKLVDGLRHFFSMYFGIAKMNGFDQQKKIVLEEYDQQNRFPLLAQHSKTIGNIIFPGTFWSRSVSRLGTPESIESFTQDDIFEYWNKNYHPSNVTMITAGGITIDEIASLLDQTIGDYKMPQLKTAEDIKKPIIATLGPVKRKTNIHTYNKKDLYGGMPIQSKGTFTSYAFLPMEMTLYKLSILSEMLNLLLLDSIREKLGSAYEINASLVSDIIAKQIKVNSPSFNLEIQDTVLSTIQENIDSLPFKSDLFEDVKDGKIVRSSSYDASVASILSRAISDTMDYGSIVTQAEKIERYKSVTIEDIAECVEYMQPEYLLHIIEI